MLISFMKIFRVYGIMIIRLDGCAPRNEQKINNLTYWRFYENKNVCHFWLAIRPLDNNGGAVSRHGSIS